MAWHGKLRPGLLLLLFSFVVISEATAKVLEQARYETAYACEGKTLKIECKDGELIKLIRANYGRFSITICNDHGNTDWSVNCMSPKSLRVLLARCSNKSNCTVEVSNEAFGGEPCIGTQKYVEAQYYCKKNATTTTTTSRPSPPWLITSQPPMWSTIKTPSAAARPSSSSTNNNNNNNKVTISPSAPIPGPPASPSSTSTVKPPPLPPYHHNPSTSTSSKIDHDLINIDENNNHHHHHHPPPPPPPPKKEPNHWNWNHNNKDDNNNNQYDITTLPFPTITSKGGNSNNNKKLPSSEITSTFSYTPSNIPSVYPSWPSKDSEYLPNHCNSTTVRNIYWKTTLINQTAVHPCPPGTTGFAKWNCSKSTSITTTTSTTSSSSSSLSYLNDLEYHSPEWSPKNPDLSECRSVWLTQLEQRVGKGELVIPVIRELSTVTGSETTLYGGDMAITAKIVQKLNDKMWQNIQTFPDTRQREEIVTEMLGYVTKASSNLLDAAQYSSWEDLSFKDRMNVATQLLIGLEENAFLLADTVTSHKTVDRKEKNILLSVRVLDSKSLTDEIFPSEDWNASNDSIELPKEALLENSDGNLVRLVFVAFDRLEEILQWKPENSENGFNINNNHNNNNITKILNSKVISASLGKGRHIQLKQPVKLTLKHIKTENVSNPKCVFWDYTTSSWSEEGCHVDQSYSNLTHTICYCDHLTNFAILMDVHDVYLPISHEIALQVITYVGCVISIICLILAIVTFQLFRGLKSDRTTIHCNLCTCLLIAEFIFLVGINRTENRIFCGIIAGLLQYFFLCAFVWMFFEGFQLYVMLIEVFEVEKSRIRWYYIFAYGLPFLILFASATVYPQGFGTIRHCWLKTDNYFIYTFVGPVLVVLLLNIIFLTMAIVMMCRHANASVSMKNKEHSRLASTRAWLKGAFVLVFLLGLTWIFGFFYINQESVAMAYLFATFNSFQGSFIFLFHCVQNEKVRKEYRKFIRRHSWLPKCLRCSKSSSSSTTTTGGGGGGTNSSGNNSGSCTTSGGGGGVIIVGGGGGGVGGKERRPSLYGGSNGNQSSGGTASTNTNSHSMDNSTTVLTPHHGTTSLQRGWNSQSCTNVNRGASPRSSTPVTTSTSVNMGATLFRPLLQQQHQQQQPPLPNNNTINDSSVPFPSDLLEIPNNNNIIINNTTNTNTSTLPYIRNIYKNNTIIINNHHNNIINSPPSPPPINNLPKSVSTWGPLHKPLYWKNISFKSYSRDSGNGGSEQEESPRSHNNMIIAAETHRHSSSSTLAKEAARHHQILHHQQVAAAAAAAAAASDYGIRSSQLLHHQQNSNHASSAATATTPTTATIGRTTKNNKLLNPSSSSSTSTSTSSSNNKSHQQQQQQQQQHHWGHHTYTEIYDDDDDGQINNSHHHHHHHPHHHLHHHNDHGFLTASEDDPVYEEIDRNNEIQVSDLSSDAEDASKRQSSDMSRQSSRSYGDHRPLIPYSPGAERNFFEVLGNNKELENAFRMRCNNIGLPSYYHHRTMNHQLQQPGNGGGGGIIGLGDTAAVRSLAAVLDGETVVCHLEPSPSELYQQQQQQQQQHQHYQHHQHNNMDVNNYVSRTLSHHHLPPYSES